MKEHTSIDKTEMKEHSKISKLFDKAIKNELTTEDIEKHELEQIKKDIEKEKLKGGFKK